VFKLVVAVLLLLAALAVLLKGTVGVRGRSAKAGRHGDAGEPVDANPAGRAVSIRWAAVPLTLLAAAFLVWASTYRLDTGEAAVLKPLSGAVHDSEAAAGFHTKAPWVQAVKFDVRNQVISFFGTTGGPKFEEGQITDQRITGQTSDNSTAYIDATITYSVDPDKVLTVYNDYRTQENLQSRKILPGVRSASQNGPTLFPTATLRQSRGKLAAQMKSDIEQNLAQAGVRVETIDLRAINFTADVEANLNQVQVARAKSNAALEDLNTARIDAEKVRVDAQAQSDADQIARCGATSAQVERVVNGQKVQETRVTPVPADKCQNRLNEQVLTSKYIDMLREAGAKGNTVYVVPQGANNLLQLPAK
jgi:hypothetical protein